MKDDSKIEIEIEFNFYQDIFILKYGLNEKLKNIFQKYCKAKGLVINSVFFVGNGNVINDFERT